MTDAPLSQWRAAQRHEQDFWESYADTYERYPQILFDHLAQLTDAGEYIRDELHSPLVKASLTSGEWSSSLRTGIAGHIRLLHTSACLVMRARILQQRLAQVHSMLDA